MTITAKYAGKCSECGGAIHQGEQIEWSKGAGARHTKCGASTVATVPAAAGATHACAKCGATCKAQYPTCYRCSPAAKIAANTCKACGHVERRNARGYVDGDWVRNGECQSCREERQMGY